MTSMIWSLFVLNFSNVLINIEIRYFVLEFGIFGNIIDLLYHLLILEGYFV